MEISKRILRFYAHLEGDENHRYKSWEHCYSYFCKDDADLDTACLHLAFYLASWGMYRGSSFLLWKDYLIHKEIVAHLLTLKELQGLNPASASENDIEEVLDLIGWIKSWYPKNIQAVNGKCQLVKVTDTLATKIILGTIGCIPAYDRYFIDGIRKTGLHYSGIKTKNFKSLLRYYKENEDQFSYAAREILNKSGIAYPPMKLLDMYFWEIGFEIDQKSS